MVGMSKIDQFDHTIFTGSIVVRDSSAVRQLFVRLAGAVDHVKTLSIRKTVDLPLQHYISTFPRFVAIRFYFLSETLK